MVRWRKCSNAEGRNQQGEVVIGGIEEMVVRLPI